MATLFKNAEFQFKLLFSWEFYGYFLHLCIWAPELTSIGEQIKLVILGEESMHLTEEEWKTCW